MIEKFAALDFEAANWQQTSVCCVGIVLMNREKIENRFYSLIHPVPDFYSWRSMEIHGLSCENTEDVPVSPMIWRKIALLMKALPLVAHNSIFDEGCLKTVLALYEIPYRTYRFYCTCRLARKFFKGLENYRLPTVSAYCGFDLPNHHSALADAEAATIIMREILKQCPVV